MIHFTLGASRFGCNNYVQIIKISLWIITNSLLRGHSGFLYSSLKSWKNRQNLTKYDHKGKAFHTVSRVWKGTIIQLAVDDYSNMKWYSLLEREGRGNNWTVNNEPLFVTTASQTTLCMKEPSPNHLPLHNPFNIAGKCDFSCFLAITNVLFCLFICPLFAKMNNSLILLFVL